jgi:hypothetical protein
VQTLEERWEEVEEKMGFANEREKFVAQQLFYLGHRSMICFLDEAHQKGEEGSAGIRVVAAELRDFEWWGGLKPDLH